MISEFVSSCHYWKKLLFWPFPFKFRNIKYCRLIQSQRHSSARCRDRRATPSIMSVGDRAVKILFAFENPLPNAQADAEVFVATAKHLAAFATRAWLHVP